MSQPDRSTGAAGATVSAADLARENEQLRQRLHEAEDTLHALRNGEIDAIVVGEDIYTLEGAEAASNRFRSDVLAQMEDAVVAMDTEAHVIYVNPAAERQYGLESSQVLGRPRDYLYRLEWLEPDDEAEAARCLQEVGHWRGRNRHLTRGGRSLLVEVTWSRLQEHDRSQAGSLQVIRDVSKRAAAEAALRESRARLDFALESARIGEWDIDLASGAARCSLQHDQCFGYAEAVEHWGRDRFLGHVHPEDRGWVAEVFDRTVASRGQMHFDCRVVWPDGSVHWLEVHGSLFDDDEDGPDRMIGTVADITERKVAEARLRDADQRKDEFLATLAHELRNPLAPIRNSMHIMRLSAAPEVHAKAQAVIERQLEQLVHLVDDLLDVSRISQGKIELRKELIDIAAVVRNAIDTSQPLIEAKRHRLATRLPEQPVIVEADMTRLTQVVANLLNNAAKYTPDGGDISLDVAAAGDEVVLTVADTGIGIPAAMLPRVFDMFTQVNRTLDRSQGGLGIGLALVRQLVLMHGGSVDGYSAGENSGATIVVRLPTIRREDRAPDAALQADAPSDGNGCRVMVVDDNGDVADSLAELLQLVGYETAVARDATQALELAQRWQPRLALLDIGLPDMTGHELARRLRVQMAGRDLVLVALTGWGQDEDRRRSFDAGFDEHLVKPVDLDRLLRLLERFELNAGAA